MAEPLIIQFAADTSRAQSAMQSLAGSIIGNMASAGVAMSGLAANSNATGSALASIAQNASRAAAAVAGDARNIASATVGAAAKERATLQSVVTAFTATAASSQTALATVQAGLSTTTGLVSGLASQIPALKAALGGLLAFTALAGALELTAAAARSAEERLESILTISTRAQAAGVGTTFFQSLIGQAKELRTEASTLEGYLTRARSAATARQGQNGERSTSSGRSEIDDQIRAGNLTRGDLGGYNAATSQEGRIRAVLDLIEKLQAGQRNLAAFSLANAFFGADFEEKLRNGVNIIGAMRQALDGLKTGDQGRIITPEEIALAERVNGELEKSRQVLAEALLPLNRDIAAYQNQQLVAMVEFKIAVNNTAAAFAGLYGYVKSVGDAITRLGNAEIFNRIYDAAKRLGLGGMNGVVDLTPEERAGKPPASKPSDDIKLDPIDVKRDRSNFIPKRPSSRSSSGSEEVDQVENYIKQLQRSTAALKAEADAFNKSNSEKLISVNLAKAQEIATQNGTKLTDAQTESIRRLSQEAADAKDNVANLEQAQRQAADAARYFGDMAANALGDAILDGKSFADILNNINRQIFRSGLQALFTGQGPLAGLLGTAAPASDGSSAVGGLAGALLGSFRPDGFRANGGPVEAGRGYTVGERGRELFIPNQSGHIVPIARGGGGDSYSGPQTMALSVDVSGARGNQEIMSMVQAGVAAGMAQTERRIGRNINGIVADGRRRYR